jgi:hypothetical protein
MYAQKGMKELYVWNKHKSEVWIISSKILYTHGKIKNIYLIQNESYIFLWEIKDTFPKEGYKNALDNRGIDEEGDYEGKLECIAYIPEFWHKDGIEKITEMVEF